MPINFVLQKCNKDSVNYEMYVLCVLCSIEIKLY